MSNLHFLGEWRLDIGTTVVFSSAVLTGSGAFQNADPPQGRIQGFIKRGEGGGEQKYSVDFACYGTNHGPKARACDSLGVAWAWFGN